MNGSINNSSTNGYQKKLESVRKYAQSQGIALDSPRGRKYAQSQGINLEDLGIEVLDTHSPADAAQTAKNYARALNLEVGDSSVRSYLNAGSENEPIDQVDIDSEVENERFKESVLHYAQSMDLPVEDERVQRYARGLLKPTGDFSTEKHAERLDRETIERRIRASVERYADSMQLSVDDPQVKKYEDGQRKGPYRALLLSAQ